MTKALLIALAVLVLPACEPGVLTQRECLEWAVSTGKSKVCAKPVTRDCWRAHGEDVLTCTQWQPYIPRGSR